MKFKKFLAVISAVAVFSTLLSIPMNSLAQPTGTPPNNNTPDATFNSVQSGGYIAFDQATIDGWMGLFGILSQGPFFGIFGATDAGYGLLGYTNTGTAVVGHSATGTGIGVSARSDGVAFETMDVTTATPSFKINGPTGNLSNPRTGSVLDSPVTITDSDGFVVADDSVGRKFFISGNNGNVYDFDSAVTVTDDDGVAIANTAGTNQLTINGTNGDISDTSGPVTVYDSDGLTVSNLIQNANSGLALARSASGWLRITPNATAGAYNTMVSAGDFLLTYTTGAVETGNLIIGPWSAAAKGIKILANGNVGIGTGNPIYKLQVQGDALGTTSGNTTSLASFSNTNGNGNAINILQKRTANGTDWNTASTRIQQRTDATDQAYIEFNPASAPRGMAFGTGSGAVERMRIDGSGNVGIGTTAPTQKLHVESGNITAPSGWVASGYNSQLPTLTADMTNIQTTATVTSTAGFPATGKIKIGNEVMSYTGTTATTFTNLTRGANFTFPTTHATAAVVGDYAFSAIDSNGDAIFGGNTYHSFVWSDSVRSKHLIIQNDNAGGITVNADNNNGPDSAANTADDIGGGITINSCADGQYETGYLAPDCPTISGDGGLEINTRTGGVSINTLTGGIVNKDPVIGASTLLPGTISATDCSASGGVAGATCNLPVRIQDNLHVTGTTRLDGNVGIGTSAPTARLDVAAPSTADPTVTLGRVTGQPTIKADTGWLIMDSTGSGAAVNYYDTANVVLAYGAGAGGNVGIGTNAPTRKLDVSKTTCGASCELARLAGSSKAITVFGDGWVGINLAAATNPSFNLHVNGSVAGVGAYVNASDLRYKKDLQPLENSLSKVLKLTGYNFEWNQDKFPDLKFKKGRDIGFIAQEVQKIVPEVISQDNEGYFSMAYGNMTALLTEAIKELNGIVENWGERVVALEKENAELKAKVEGLEERLERLEAMVR